MKKAKRVGLIIGAILVCLGGLLWVPYSRAKGVMALMTFYESKENAQDITLSFKAKNWLGWFDQMILFTDKGGFDHQIGRESKLDIYYTFGQFNKGRSDIYRPESPYYSSFVGAYVLSGEEGDYMNHLQGQAFVDEVAKIPQYDYTKLILRDLGCPPERQVFDYKLISAQDNLVCAGEAGFDVFNLQIETSGLAHQDKGFIRHYIQFGRPLEMTTSFAPLTQYARVYVKTFPQKQAVLIFYCLSPDLSVIEATDQELLQTAVID